MPTYEVQAPDGKKFSVNAPQGATQDDAIKYVQTNFYGPQKVDMPSKGVGAQLGDALGDIPRQLGLTARYGIEGVTGALGALSEPIRAGLNLIPGVNIASGDAAGTGVADILHLPKPQTSLERVVAEPTKMLAGVAGLGGAARKVAEVPGMVGRVASLLSENIPAQVASAVGGGTAGGYVKETGGGALPQLAASVVGGLAAPTLINAVKSIPNAAKKTVEFLAPGLAKAPDLSGVDIVINNALKGQGVSVGDLSASVANQLRQDVNTALQTNGTLSPDAIRRIADYRLTGATPTRATITLDPADISRQKNAAKFGINSADPKLQQLGQIENANNRTLIQNLNDLGAGTPDDKISGAQSVIQALKAKNDAAKNAIDSAYQAARETSGRSAAFDHINFANNANNLLDDALLGGKLPGDVRNLLNKAATGEMPLTVDTAEQFKTRIGDLQRASNDGAERKALGLVRQALDDAPLIQGQGQGAVDAFNNARSMNRAWMKVVEDTPALQAVRDGIEPDKFVQQFIIGTGSNASVMDVAKLKDLVGKSPEAMQAIRGQIAAHLKEQALNRASDEVGNFSQSNFNKALQAIGDRKLALFFSKPEIAQLKAVGRVSSYEQVQPRGSAVNNSNTAGAGLAAIFDKLANSPLMAKVPMGPQFVGNISASINARKALNAPAALAIPQIKPRTQPLLLPMLAASGLLSGE